VIDLEYKKNLQKAVFDDLSFLDLIHQGDVTLSQFPPDCPYNSIWDYAVSPEGRHFVALCGEGNSSLYVQLHEYLPATGEFVLCFKLEDAVTTYSRTIRASKIHTSICFMPDGRLIMTTHTTASAPSHPHWLYFHYLNHPFEGYIGSNIITYDPKTGKTEDLGIPVQRDTIYGACYDPSHNALYFNTYLKGHAYRFDLDGRKLTNYGQVTEQGSFFLKLGRDGNIYTSTRNGCLIRYNTETQEVEDLGFRFPESIMLGHAEDGPDGRLYLFANWCPYICAYDYDTGKTEVVCPGAFDGFKEGTIFGYYGGGFDEYGVLWYVLRAHRGNSEGICAFTFLCRLDLNEKNPKPVNMGLLGNRRIMPNCCCECFVRDDTFFAITSNHATDSPGVFKIGLESLRKNESTPRERCMDPWLYIGFTNGQELYDGDLLTDGEIYYRATKEMQEWLDYSAANPYSFGTEKHDVTPVWMELGYDRSSVVHVEFNGNSDIDAVCGSPGNYTRITVRDGRIIGKEENFGYTEPDPNEIAAKFAHVKLPCHAGRGFLAKASAYCELAGGKRLVGTADGMLAVVDGDHVFSLGAVAVGEAVRSIVSNGAGTEAYGVASDPDGFGMMFRYSVDTGVELYGFVQGNAGGGMQGHTYEPYAVAFAPDDKSVAIGGKGKMGTVYRFYL